MNSNKEPIFSLGLMVFSDDSHKQIVKLAPGNERLIAGIIFAMTTGQISQTVMKNIEKQYPKEFKLIQQELEVLISEFHNIMEKVEKEMSDSPVIPPSKVFSSNESRQ